MKGDYLKNKQKKKTKHIVLLLIIIAITVYLVYSKINLYNTKKSYDNTVEIINNTNDYSNEIIDDYINEISEEQYYTSDDIIGYLIIPKIELKGPIKQGSSSLILRDYIGHIEETSLYDGNIGLAAHNRGNKYSFFANINQLEIGDDIYYDNVFGKSHYKVNQIKEIDEEDWSMLNDTGENKLTLITCIKNKRRLRLCVQSNKI